MIPIWGRAGTVDYVNNVGRNMRGTMYVQVNANLTVTDHIIRDTVSSYTRYGMRLQHAPYKGQLSLLINVQNYTLKDVLLHGHTAVAACNSAMLGSCSGAHAGGVAIEGLEITNASTAFDRVHNCRPHDTPGPHPIVNASFTGTGLGIYALRNFSLLDSAVGAQIEDTLSEDTYNDGRIEGCDVRVNCTAGMDCRPLLRSLGPDRPA